MDCPRCGLSIQKQEYEGENVFFCSTCWGHWLRRDQLDNIINEVRYRFNKDEIDAVLTAMTQKGDA